MFTVIILGPQDMLSFSLHRNWPIGYKMFIIFREFIMFAKGSDKCRFYANPFQNIDGCKGSLLFCNFKLTNGS